MAARAEVSATGRASLSKTAHAGGTSPLRRRASLRQTAPVPATVVVGAQWGDEGKGKIVDLLAQQV